MTSPKSATAFLLGVLLLSLLGSFGPFRTQVLPMAAASGPAYVQEDSTGIKIGNNLVEIFLDKTLSATGLPISRISNKLTGWDYHMRSPWLFDLSLRDRSGNFLGMGAIGFQTPTSRVLRVGNGSSLQLNWPTNLEYGKSVAVSATITVYDTSALTRWNIQITNHDNDLALYNVRFPIIDGLERLGASSTDLVVINPHMGGARLIRDPLRIPWEYAGALIAGDLYPTRMPVQFMSFFDAKGAGGVYLATDDTQGYFKWFDVSLNPSNSKLQTFVKHYSPVAFRSNYALPYSVLFGVYQGNTWQSAADIYKSWALKQWWAEKKLGEKNTSSWFTNLAGGFVGGAYTAGAYQVVSYSELASTSKAVNNTFHLFKSAGQLPLVLTINGWEAKGGGRYYPDIFPPLEGDAALKDFVNVVHSMGMKVGAWIIVAYEETTPGGPSMQTEGRNYLTVDEYGNKYTAVWGIVQEEVPGIEWANIDVSSDYWRNALTTIMTKLVRDYGFDLLHLDTFPGQEVSYNPNATHVPGGGTYGFGTWRDIIQTVRDATKSYKPDLAIFVEGASEVFLPYVDGAFMGEDVWDFGLGVKGEGIPLFSYLYHPYTILSGAVEIRSAPMACLPSCQDESWRKEYVTKDRFPYIDRYWFSVVSREFVKGKVSTLTTAFSEDFLTKVTQPGKLQFWEKAAYARFSYAKDFLVYGDLLAPSFMASAPTFNLTTSDWWEFAGINNSGRIKLQSVESGVWRSTDGRVAYFFVNAWNRPVSFSLQINFLDIGLIPGNQYRAYQLIDGLTGSSQVSTNSASLSMTLAPQQIGMVELTPETPQAQNQLLSMHALSAIDTAQAAILRARYLGRIVGLDAANSALQRAQDAYSSSNYGDAISAAIVAKEKADSTGWSNTYSVTLRLKITTNAHWASIILLNAKISRVLQPPTLNGKGNLYAATDGPLLTGMNPIVLTFEEKHGYQIIYDPSSGAPDLEVGELSLVIALNSSETGLQFQIGKESWDVSRTVKLEILNILTGTTLFSSTQTMGWSQTMTLTFSSLGESLGSTISAVYSSPVTLGFELTTNIYDNAGAGYMASHRSGSNVVFTFNDATMVNAGSYQLTFTDYGNAVLVGGRLANPTVGFYEYNGFAPLTAVMNANGMVSILHQPENTVALNVPFSSLGASNDYFVMECLNDAGHAVVILWGITQWGTLASGVYFDMQFPNLANLSQGSYVIHWQDSDSNGIPDPADTFTVVFNGT